MAIDQIHGLLTVSEAATNLGVSRQRVLRLIADGELRALRSGRQWLVSRADVRRRASRTQPRGQRFSPARAWAIIFLASGRDVTWLRHPAPSILRRQLKEHGLAGLRDRLALRGRPHYLRAHPGDLARLAAEPGVVATGASAARASGIVQSERFEAYVPESRLPQLVRRYHLSPSLNANVVLRALPKVVSPLLMATEAPVPAVALDLLDDDDPRAQEAGERLLMRYDP